MSRRSRNFLVAGAVAVAIAVSVVGVAYSAAPAPVSGGPAGVGLCATQAAAVRSSATVETLRAFGDCEIGRRLTTLHQLGGAVDAAVGLTSADAANLSSKISADVDGLTGLRATIDAQTRVAPLKSALVQVVTGYRVYEVLVPQVRLVVAADGELALAPHFDQLATTLAGRLPAAQAKGKDTTAAQASIDAMNTAVAHAVTLATPMPAKLLALTPASYASGAATSVFKTARTALTAARDELKAAAQDARDALTDLR